MRFHSHFGVGLVAPIGDKAFGLVPFDASANEFEWVPSLHLGVGVVPPGRNVNVGFRLDFGLGPLNRAAWEKALGVELAGSVLFDAAFYAQYQFVFGREVAFVGLDGGFVSLGTSTSQTEENGEVTSSIDNKVGYWGWTGGLYIGAQRSMTDDPEGSVHWFGQLRYGFRSWQALETDGPAQVPAVRDDAKSMHLGHVMLIVGIKGLITPGRRRKLR